MLRRRLSAMLSTALLASGLALVSGAGAPASAACAPPAGEVIYKISNITKSFKPTGPASNWVHPRYGSASITYSKSESSTWGGTLTGTVSAEAGVVFAKASTSISVAVTRNWSKTETWTYGTTVAKDPAHEYRMRQMQETRKFYVKKFQFSRATCAYSNQVGTGHGEMPRATKSSLVWKQQRRAA